MTDFDDADYYDVRRDEDSLRTTLEDALAEFFDCDGVGELDEADVRDRCPVEVDAYVRAPFPEDLMRGFAESAVESACERWADDFGAPFYGDVLPDDTRALLEGLLASAFAEAFKLARSVPTKCIGERAFQAEEVIAILRAGESGAAKDEAPRGEGET